MNRRQRMHQDERQPRNRRVKHPEARKKKGGQSTLPWGLGQPTTWGTAICAAVGAAIAGGAIFGLCAGVSMAAEAALSREIIKQYHCQMAAMTAGALGGLIAGGLAMFILPAFIPEDNDEEKSR